MVSERIDSCSAGRLEGDGESIEKSALYIDGDSGKQIKMVVILIDD